MLRIHETAIELVGDVVVLLEVIERRDPDLARQGRRAVMSVPLNVSEGANQSGRRREQHYRYALGSAREAWSVVRVAHAAKYIDAPSPELTNKFNTVIGSLHRCLFKRVA